MIWNTMVLDQFFDSISIGSDLETVNGSPKRFNDDDEDGERRWIVDVIYNYYQ